MIEPLKGWTSWPSSSSQDVTDGNFLGMHGWCWCRSNRVSLNIFVSTPASAKVSLTHREIDADVTGLWGFLKEIMKLRALHSKLGCLLYIYIQCFTGHRESACLNALKKICLGGPDRSVFVSIHKYQANTTEYISENIHRLIWHMLLAVTNNTIAKYITLVAQSLGHSLLNQMNLPKHKERSAV